MDMILKKILNTDKIQNIASIGYFKNYPVEEFYFEGSSAMIFGKSDHLWAHFISNSEVELSRLLEKYQSKTKYFYSVEDWMIPMILKYGSEDWRMETNRFVLNPDIHIPSSKYKFIELNNSFSKFMFDNSDYKDFISIDYINDCLEKDISAGLMIDNQLIAWGFPHDDGALGFLHVLDDFRKKGYGENILLSLLEKRRQTKKPVFCNIVPENKASTNLAKKYGFDFDRKVSWIKLK